MALPRFCQRCSPNPRIPLSSSLAVGPPDVLHYRSKLTPRLGKQGITNPPGNPAYNASKAALRSLAESLSLSLSSSHPQISVHLLIPGWTHTGLTGASAPGASGQPNPKPDGAWLPEQVARYLYDAMGRGEFYIICPDNETTEAIDRRRMRWGNEDLVERRPPLTRWRNPEWKRKADEWMGAEEAVGR